MKKILIMITLLTAQMAFSQSAPYIDDLDSIPLRLETESTPVVQINYPGYRINGGRPATINDCLILDVMDSDHVVTIKQKMAFAKKIEVRDGFMFGRERNGTELKPRVHGNSVVFPLVSIGTYMTHIQATARDSKTLLKVIEENLLPSNDPTSPIHVNLLYVRGCRL